MRFQSNFSVHRSRLSMVPAWLAVLLAAFLVAACGGGGGSSSSSSASTTSATSTIASAAANVLAINVKEGPEAGLINAPFVTITVCAPGTSTCDTIDNVIVDTASVGLRVLASAVPNSLSGMSRIQLTATSQYLGVCGQFLSGYTWGTGRLADIKMSGESASNVPIQVIADPAAGTTAPSNCSSTGSSVDYTTAASMGGNAILGVEGLVLDCGATCVTTARPQYFACSSSTTCSTSAAETTVPLSQQMTNPVSKFTTDNNGVIVEMPVISASGAATATGALVFGIGTQSNNAVGSATVVQTDGNYEFKSTYNGTTNAGAFVDSGSSVYYVDDSIATCSSSSDYAGWYCPTSTVTRSATFSSNNSSATGTYATSINIANTINTIGSNNYYAYNDLGYYQSGMMDFGLPFFYGKNVFVKMETATGAANGYLAFISNVN